MEGRQYDWQAIRARYEEGGISFKKLSEQYGVPVSVIGKRAKREDWQGDRKLYAKKRPHGDLHSSATKLLDMAAELVHKVEGEEQMDVKTLKELTSVLRELNNLSKNIEEDNNQDTVVRVVLEGEAKEWAL